VTSILRWGRGLIGTWVEEDCEAWPYDTVIGADIVGLSFPSNKFILLTSGRHTIKLAFRPSWLRFDFYSTCGQSCEPSSRVQSATPKLSRVFGVLAVRLDILFSFRCRNADVDVVRNQFAVVEVEFKPKTMREQTALFYATAVPLKILMITRPN